MSLKDAEVMALSTLKEVMEEKVFLIHLHIVSATEQCTSGIQQILEAESQI